MPFSASLSKSDLLSEAEKGIKADGGTEAEKGTAAEKRVEGKIEEVGSNFGECTRM